MTPNLAPEKLFLRWPVFFFLGLGLLVMYLGDLPAGIIGVACLLLPFAHISTSIGGALIIFLVRPARVVHP